MNWSDVSRLLFVIFLVIWSVITFVDNSTEVFGKFIAAVIFFLSVAMGWQMRQTKRGHKRDVPATWQALAKQTGLTFENGPLVSRGTGFSPSLRGEYRGHYISMTLVVERSCGDNDRILTQTSLMASGDGSTSLEVRARRIFDKIIRKDAIPSGSQQFDRAFLVRGSPADFVRRALRVILRHKTILLSRPDDLISLSLTTWIRPSITLEKAELVGVQHGVHTDIKKQKVFLDLLCDIADLAEELRKREEGY